MAKFRDNKNREWILEWDVFLAERVLAGPGFNLDTCLEENLKGLVDLNRNSPLMARVVYLMCEDQADKASVTPEDFGRSLGGDALQGMRKAFMEAVADFYPAHQRQILRALVAKGEEVAEKAARLGVKEIERHDPFASVTSSPATSGSTPAPEG